MLITTFAAVVAQIIRKPAFVLNQFIKMCRSFPSYRPPLAKKTGGLAHKQPTIGRNIMTNHELKARYETAEQSINDQRNRASAQSYAAGASILAGDTPRTKAWAIWPERFCISFFMLLPSIMLTIYVL